MLERFAIGQQIGRQALEHGVEWPSAHYVIDFHSSKGIGVARLAPVFQENYMIGVQR